MNRAKHERVSWEKLPTITHGNGQTYVTARAAAEYLGLHVKAFFRLTKQLAITPDMDKRWVGMNLYTRATLDRIDQLRKPIGRPTKAVNS